MIIINEDRELVKFGKYTYTWDGNFPVFRVSRVDSEECTGFLAKCGEIEIFFPCGASWTCVRSVLDEAIFSLIQWAAFAEDMGLIDIDSFMSDLPQDTGVTL